MSTSEAKSAWTMSLVSWPRRDSVVLRASPHRSVTPRHHHHATPSAPPSPSAPSSLYTCSSPSLSLHYRPAHRCRCRPGVASATAAKSSLPDRSQEALSSDRCRVHALIPGKAIRLCNAMRLFRMPIWIPTVWKLVARYGRCPPSDKCYMSKRARRHDSARWRPRLKAMKRIKAQKRIWFRAILSCHHHLRGRYLGIQPIYHRHMLKYRYSLQKYNRKPHAQAAEVDAFRADTK